MLPYCLYYVDKITLVRRKKYKVQNISGKFSHLDIWKICMCNLHRHKSQFIKMKFYLKIWTKKKNGVYVSVVYLHLSVGIGSSVHWDSIHWKEHFIFLQAKHMKALFFPATETILSCSKCRSAAEPRSYMYSHSHALPQILRVYLSSFSKYLKFLEKAVFTCTH